MAKYKIGVGEDFHIEALKVESIEEVSKLSQIAMEHRRARDQSRLSMMLMGFIALAIIVSTAVGIVDGSFNEISAVWFAVALPLGYVLKSHYRTSLPP